MGLVDSINAEIINEVNARKAGRMALRNFATNDMSEKRVTILVYGTAGIGKTTLASTLPVEKDERVLFIAADPGHLALRKRAFKGVQIVTEDKKDPEVDLWQLHAHLKKSPKDFDWLVIDGIDEIANDVLRYQRFIESRADKPNAYAPYDRMAESMLRWLKSMRDLPTNVLFITHMDNEQGARPANFPQFPGVKAWRQLPNLFDEVGCMRQIEQPTEKGTKIVRLIQFQPEADPAYLVKDRSGALAGFEKPDIAAIFKKIHGAVGRDVDDKILEAAGAASVATEKQEKQSV